MTRGRVTIRTADAAHAKRLHTLISDNLVEGHLLPRTLAEIAAHAERFVIAVRGRSIVGCAELAPLSPAVAEVRSLAVGDLDRGRGLGAQLVEELRRRAAAEGFEKLCAFTHSPSYFIHMGFSIVPHLWLPEKMAKDCFACPRFRACGQYAMVIPLDGPRSLEDGHEPAMAVEPPAVFARHA
jgi:amino-acid N-acetyltransferase